LRWRRRGKGGEAALGGRHEPKSKPKPKPNSEVQTPWTSKSKSKSKANPSWTAKSKSKPQSDRKPDFEVQVQPEVRYKIGLGLRVQVQFPGWTSKSKSKSKRCLGVPWPVRRHALLLRGAVCLSQDLAGKVRELQLRLRCRALTYFCPVMRCCLLSHAVVYTYVQVVRSAYEAANA
jgi:hypothetical protein